MIGIFRYYTGEFKQLVVKKTELKRSTNCAFTLCSTWCQRALRCTISLLIVGNSGHAISHSDVVADSLLEHLRQHHIQTRFHEVRQNHLLVLRLNQQVIESSPLEAVCESVEIFRDKNKEVSVVRLDYVVSLQSRPNKVFREDALVC